MFLSVLVPLQELRPHFSLASESDQADQEDDDDDTVPHGSPAHKSRAPPIVNHDDTVATSGVSTLSSTVSHESRTAQHSVNMELGRMKLETSRWAAVILLCVSQGQYVGMQKSSLSSSRNHISYVAVT